MAWKQARWPPLFITFLTSCTVMTPYQVSSEIYGGFFYSGITLTWQRSWPCFIDFFPAFITYYFARFVWVVSFRCFWFQYSMHIHNLTQFSRPRLICKQKGVLLLFDWNYLPWKISSWVTWFSSSCLTTPKRKLISLPSPLLLWTCFRRGKDFD